MMNKFATRIVVATVVAMATPGHAQNLISIDATSPVAQPIPVIAKLGASRNPSGHVLAANSQYLTMDGKPWIPVMGEFHFSRYPAAEWEQEILKMKSAGVGIISSYVIWNHHEQIKGQFDWAGQRNLRKFVELCGKHGMYVYPRIGPWAHAEVRHGGFPDWVLKNGPVRQNDPTYLKEVQSFYLQIALQLKGQLWKDGGPVIGIQIENEYRGNGPGKGVEHIRELKKMAIADGLDVPLYTVTGWDGAAIPLDEVLPVFGGYPDAPWDGSSKAEYGNEIYAFRFNNRVAGSMGAVGGRGQNSAASYQGTPFLTAEVGAGGQDTYFRRPVFSTNDIAAIAPVMLGSGVNLLGYYMFHGGTNPNPERSQPPITLEESQRVGDATDVPEKSYDFQAPFGEFGQERESLRKLKLVHYFLEDFGSQLAPMTTREPAQVPSGPTDTSVTRAAARVKDDSGFIFVNNYVRGLNMPARKDFQVNLKLPSGTVKVPDRPMDLPSDAYCIWPVNLSLGDAGRLRYSTAQLFKRIVLRGETYYFFFAIPAVAAEFALDAGTKVKGTTGQVEQVSLDGGERLRVTSNAADVALNGGVHLVLMPESEAENIWRGDDPTMLLETAANVFSDGALWTLQADDPNIKFSIFGTVKPSSNQPLKDTGNTHLFVNYQATLPKLELQATVTKVHDAKPRAAWAIGEKLSWRPEPIPLKPAVSEFDGAAVWRIEVPRVPTNASVSDVWLKIHYQGDVARLSTAGGLVDDNFWNGLSWAVGLKETLPAWRTSASTLDLSVLPLPKNYPMYLEKAHELQFDTPVGAASLQEVELVPQYQLLLQLPK